MNKTYIETDAESGFIKKISLKEVRKDLTGHYYDVSIAVDALKKGKTVRTPFWYYNLER